MTISVRGLTRTFVTGRRARRRSTDAVLDVTFDVAPGERLAYIGPNSPSWMVQPV